MELTFGLEDDFDIQLLGWTCLSKLQVSVYLVACSLSFFANIVTLEILIAHWKSTGISKHYITTLI